MHEAQAQASEVPPSAPQMWMQHTFACTESMVCPSVPLTATLRAFYSARHRLLDSLRLRVPVTSDAFFLGKQWSLLEVLVAILLLAALPAIQSSESSGELTSYVMVITCALAVRSFNFLTILGGIPLERALAWHKIGAYTTFLCVIVHGITSGIDGPGWSGLIMAGGFAGLGVSAVFAIRQKSYEVFFYTHMSMLIVLAIGAYYHNAPFIFLGIGLVGLDFIIRFARMRKVTAVIKRLPSDVTRIEFDRGSLKFSAGQYLFVCVPALGPQFHPFSFSSSPHEDTVMLHVRALGGWTRSLQNLPDKGETGSYIETSIYVEGPYGALSIDLNSDKYKIVLLISGGIGVTPMQSIASQLLHQHQQGRPLKKVIFIWSVREKKVGDPKELESAMDQALPLYFQPNLLSSLNTNPSEITSNELLHTEFYLTSSKTSGPETATFESAVSGPTAARPNLREIFSRVSAYAKVQGETQVAVLTCGPMGMTADVVMNSRLASRDGSLRFDCHHETFQL